MQQRVSPYLSFGSVMKLAPRFRHSRSFDVGDGDGDGDGEKVCDLGGCQPA
jgi:hypothetical protein